MTGVSVRTAAVRWALLPATVAPVALVGGWVVAASRQPSGYNSTRDTISALAAHGATDRWLMTAALILVGACYLASAAALTTIRTPGRIGLAVGGAATIAVGLFPQPVHGGSAWHIASATLGFLALMVWPVLGSVPTAGSGTGAPTRACAVAVSAILAALLVWFAVQLRGGGHIGLSERLLASAEAAWPLIVVLLIIKARSRPSPNS